MKEIAGERARRTRAPRKTVEEKIAILEHQIQNKETELGNLKDQLKDLKGTKKKKDMEEITRMISSKNLTLEAVKNVLEKM